jgi:hypothetical protein
MRRLFWVAVGAAAGVYAVRKVQKTLHAYSASGLAERAGGVGDSLRLFADEVRAGMAEREAELRDALGLTEPTELTPAEAAELTDHPARPRPTRRSAS